MPYYSFIMHKEKDSEDLGIFKALFALALETSVDMYFPRFLWPIRICLLWFTHTYNSGCCHGFVASLSNMLSIHNVML